MEGSAGFGGRSARPATDPGLSSGSACAGPDDRGQDLPLWPLFVLLLALALVGAGTLRAAPAGPGALLPEPEFPAGRPRLVLLGVNSQGFQEYRNRTDGTTLIRIPQGEFTMGTDDARARADERPAHLVRVEEFLIGKHEVTHRQFQHFLEVTGSWSPRENREERARAGDQSPVVHLDWYGVQDYCRWAGLRLPTEAEWEKAARGDDGRRYPWGPTWGPGRAWSAEDPPGRARRVGARPRGASPYGCLDMSGNVWEWCLGWHDRYPGGGEDPAQDPARRVVRGGSWSSEPEELRTTARVPVRTGVLDHYGNLGFRVAVSWSPQVLEGGGDPVQATPRGPEP